MTALKKYTIEKNKAGLPINGRTPASSYRCQLFRPFLFALAALAMFTSGPAAWAANAVWRNITSDFNTGSNWSAGTGPGGIPGTGDVAVFNTRSVDPILSGSLTIQSLSFGSNASGYTLSNTNAAALTLTNEGTDDTVAASAIRASNTSGTNTVSSALTLGGAASSTQSFSQAAGGTLIVSGAISNTNAITFRLGGTGTIRLSGNNSSLNASLSLASNTTLQIGNNNALGSGTLTVGAAGTTVQSDSSTARILSNAITLGTPTTTFGAGGDLSFGTALLNADRTVVVNNGITTFANTVNTGAAQTLTKSGSGNLIITGTAAHGGSVVTAGVLAVTGTYSSSGNMNLQGGVLGLNGALSRGLGSNSSQVRFTAGSSGLAATGTNATWGHSANNLTVNLGGSGATLTYGTTANFLTSGQTLVLGAAISNGTVTFANGLDLAGATQTIQVVQGTTNTGGGSDAIISGTMSNGGLEKTGNGKLTLTASNTFTGSTTVSGGTLEANATSGQALASTTAVTINSGGTLLLGKADQINNSAAVNLAGGTLNLAGFAETTVGALTLSVNSTIDFGAGSSGLIQFASINHTGGILSILNWTGTPYVGNTGDRLLFTGNTTDFTSQFTQSQVSFNGISGFSTVQYSGFYELVAVPEPATILCGFLLFGFLIWKENKRLKALLARHAQQRTRDEGRGTRDEGAAEPPVQSAKVEHPSRVAGIS